jgi:hypothetical protein
MHHRPPARSAHRIVPRQPETTLELERPWSEMIPMHPDLIRQIIADRQADLMASARRARPAQRGRAVPMLAALGRLAWRRSSPRTVQMPAAGPGQAAPTLTPRELDLLKLVAQGLTNPDIAAMVALLASGRGDGFRPLGAGQRTAGLRTSDSTPEGTQRGQGGDAGSSCP